MFSWEGLLVFTRWLPYRCSVCNLHSPFCLHLSENSSHRRGRCKWGSWDPCALLVRRRGRKEGRKFYGKINLTFPLLKACAFVNSCSKNEVEPFRFKWKCGGHSLLVRELHHHSLSSWWCQSIELDLQKFSQNSAALRRETKGSSFPILCLQSDLFSEKRSMNSSFCAESGKICLGNDSLERLTSRVWW